MHLGTTVWIVQLSREQTPISDLLHLFRPAPVPLFLAFVFRIEERDRRSMVSTWALDGAQRVRNWDSTQWEIRSWGAMEPKVRIASTLSGVERLQ